MRRRRFLVAGTALIFASPASPQSAGRTYRVAAVYLAASSTTKPYEEAFLAGLGELGFERGRNLAYDVRNCDGDPSRLLAAVDEVIALKPDLLVGIEQVARLMRSKTATTPIVLTQSNDPVAAGLAKTLARPGTNVTGMAALTDAMAIKQVEMLKELIPQLKSVAVFMDPNVPGSADMERHVTQGANALGVKTSLYKTGDRKGLAQAFAEIERNRPDGIVNPSGSGTLFGERHFIAENALRLRVPCAGLSAASAEAGYVMTYGASLQGMFRGAASHAARILKGASPADLPIERPTQFELVLNLKTAKAIGIKVPQSMLVRANRVIE